MTADFPTHPERGACANQTNSLHAGRPLSEVISMTPISLTQNTDVGQRTPGSERQRRGGLGSENGG